MSHGESMRRRRRRRLLSFLVWCQSLVNCLSSLEFEARNSVCAMIGNEIGVRLRMLGVSEMSEMYELPIAVLHIGYWLLLFDGV